MRITGGKYKNKVLMLPTNRHSSVHQKFPIRPTMAKTRQAAFNILEHANFIEADVVEDALVLDLCCGCGSFGLESLSRGARGVTFIDSNFSNLNVARQNAESLGVLLECRFLQNDITALPMADRQYNLIYIDPPYNKTMEVLSQAVERLRIGGWLAPFHVIVVETGKRMAMHNISGFKLRAHRNYGNTNLYFLQCME